jgi:hypothetical protein
MSATESAKSIVTTAMQDPRVAVPVGGGTGGAGLIGILTDYLPTSAEVAALCGAVLSLVLAYNHWKGGKIRRQKEKAELELLRQQLKKHQD